MSLVTMDAKSCPCYQAKSSPTYLWPVLFQNIHFMLNYRFHLVEVFRWGGIHLQMSHAKSSDLGGHFTGRFKAITRFPNNCSKRFVSCKIGLRQFKFFQFNNHLLIICSCWCRVCCDERQKGQPHFHCQPIPPMQLPSDDHGGSTVRCCGYRQDIEGKSCFVFNKYVFDKLRGSVQITLANRSRC